MPDLGGENEPDTNPTQDIPQIAPVLPLEPVPDVPQTPPANLAPLEPFHDPPSPEQSPTIPIAIRHTRREIRPPNEWWKVRHPTPAVESDSEDSGDDFDNIDSESAGAAHDLDPKCYEARRRECAEANCKIARSSDTISDS